MIWRWNPLLSFPNLFKKCHSCFPVLDKLYFLRIWLEAICIVRSVLCTRYVAICFLFDVVDIFPFLNISFWTWKPDYFIEHNRRFHTVALNTKSLCSSRHNLNVLTWSELVLTFKDATVLDWSFLTHFSASPVQVKVTCVVELIGWSLRGEITVSAFHKRKVMWNGNTNIVPASKGLLERW